jgi:hypothetical protein
MCEALHVLIQEQLPILWLAAGEEAEAEVAH